MEDPKGEKKKTQKPARAFTMAATRQNDTTHIIVIYGESYKIAISEHKMKIQFLDAYTAI